MKIRNKNNPNCPAMSKISLFWIYTFLCLLWNTSVLCQNTVSGQNVTICLSSDGPRDPLQLPDPFPAGYQAEDSFVVLTWVRYTMNSSGVLGPAERLTEHSVGSPDAKLLFDRAKVYESWGLQLSDVGFADTGRYEAVLVRTSGESRVATNVVVATSPMLKSAKLEVSRRVNEQAGEVILSCGILDNLGTPPVELFWRAPNGSALHGTFQNGNLTLTISKDEVKTPATAPDTFSKAKFGDGTFSCELGKASPAAECISSADRPRWEGSYVFPSKTGGGETNIIIVVAIICAIIVGLVVIVVVVVLLRRGKKGEAYNTKDEEAKANTEQGGPNSPLMIQDDSNPYDRPNAAKGSIYTGPRELSSPGHTANLYAVSGLNLSENQPNPRPMDLPPKKKKVPMALTENTDNLNGNGGGGKPSGRYKKKGDSKDSGGKGGDDIDGKEPPTPKKRSIFLTESNEALDRIAEAVAGGKGSGADGGMASESTV